MKGLLLKDFYLIVKYCGAQLFAIVLFAGVSLFYDNSLFRVYPGLFAAMIPVMLYSYDEREKWCSYSQTLPISKVQYVSEKYLLGLAVVFVMAIVMGVVQGFGKAASFPEPVSTAFTMAELLLAGLVSLSFLLPFLFKFGAEKGRIAYMIVIGAVCALVVMGESMAPISFTVIVSRLNLPLILILAAALYLISWLLSENFYQKREI